MSNCIKREKTQHLVIRRSSIVHKASLRVSNGSLGSCFIGNPERSRTEISGDLLCTYPNSITMRYRDSIISKFSGLLRSCTLRFDSRNASNSSIAFTILRQLTLQRAGNLEYVSSDGFESHPNQTLDLGMPNDFSRIKLSQSCSNLSEKYKSFNSVDIGRIR